MSTTDKKTKKKLAIEPAIFYPPFILLGIFCSYIILNPEAGNALLNKAFSFLTGPLGWSYEWFTLAFLGIVIYFMFGKYGNKRLGDEKPEFSTFTWLVMLFTAATSAGLMFWASIEFFYYLQSPPFGAEPFSPDAMSWASCYGMYHWGFLPNGMYALLALVFGYLFYVKKQDVIRPSTACYNVLGEKVNGWAGKLIDVFFVVALIAGVGTSLGLGTPLVGELIAEIFGMQHNLSLDAIIILIWTTMIAISVYTGLKKGIKLLGLLRIYLAFAFLLFVLIVGPTSFIFNNFTESVGHMMQNFLRMSLYTDPHVKSGFPQGWTIFYWAWWIAYALQMGIYFARVSKGRTVRELCLGVLCATSLGAWIFFAVLGNYAFTVHTQNVLPIADILSKSGGAAAVVAIWATLPFKNVTLFFLLILSFISTATLLNGSAYTLAMVTTKKIGGEEEPAGWNRVFWALVLGGVSLALMFLGGLQPLQTSSIVGSFPMMFVAIIILISFLKDIKKGWASKDEYDDKESCESKIV